MIYSRKKVKDKLESNQANKSSLIYSGQEDFIINELITNLNGKLNLKSQTLSSSCSKNVLNDECDYFLNNQPTFNLKNQKTNRNKEAYFLTQLLEEGSLIKEAVRRLQFNQS